jgi:Mg-chelatase subunit ChlD
LISKLIKLIQETLMVDMRLEGKDYVITLDRSGSMDSDVRPGYTRWQQAQEYTMSLAKFANKYDPDGIKVITFNGRSEQFDNVTEEKVAEVFKTISPMGGTCMAPALKLAFDSYIARKKANETNNGEINIVVCDGEPSDRLEVMKAIAEFTKSLDSHDEYGITFIQTGNDSSARDFLKALDDKLESAGAKYDIVDTKTCDEIDQLGLSVEDILVAALDD